MWLCDSGTWTWPGAAKFISSWDSAFDPNETLYELFISRVHSYYFLKTNRIQSFKACTVLNFNLLYLSTKFNWFSVCRVPRYMYYFLKFRILNLVQPSLSSKSFKALASGRPPRGAFDIRIQLYFIHTSQFKFKFTIHNSQYLTRSGPADDGQAVLVVQYM
eukprot:SAG31_NODE_7950_length_1556_cov_1.045985_1_plen_161_part_00